jgi:hypothetical protein
MYSAAVIGKSNRRPGDGFPSIEYRRASKEKMVSKSAVLVVAVYCAPFYHIYCIQRAIFLN